MSGGSLASGEEKISLKTGVHSAGYQSSGSMSNEEGNGINLETEPRVDRFTKWRNIIGFWILGLCNNFPYVIMLSAAFDIILQLENGGGGSSPNSTNQSNQTIGSCDLQFNETTNMSYYIGREKCAIQGTSEILLADILPTFFIKLIAPYFMTFLPYWFRVIIVVISSALSFVLVALSINEALVIFGVALASVASGFGEITYLSLTARYDKSTVTAWSSGTGAAGVGGSLVYAGLKTFLSPKVTLFIQLVIPVIMFVAYLFVLGKPGNIVPEENNKTVQRREVKGEGDVAGEDDSSSDTEDKDAKALLGTPMEEHVPKIRSRWRIKGINKEEAMYWLRHVKYIPHLYKYMIPLFGVYCAEYMINQGFFELLYNENTHIGALCLDQAAQYRWLQVIYQVGVFVSRSSVSVYHFKHYWILSILQIINFVFFFCAAWYLFIPSFWLTFFLVLYEGLLGGGVYVNAFYSISIEVPKVHREFSLGVASVADSTGITVAAVAAHFIHLFICQKIGYLNGLY